MNGGRPNVDILSIWCTKHVQIEPKFHRQARETGMKRLARPVLLNLEYK